MDSRWRLQLRPDTVGPAGLNSNGMDELDRSGRDVPEAVSEGGAYRSDKEMCIRDRIVLAYHQIYFFFSLYTPRPLLTFAIYVARHTSTASFLILILPYFQKNDKREP